MEAPCRTEAALRLSEEPGLPALGVPRSLVFRCPCQGARYGSHLGYSRWFQPQAIAAEQQMNFPDSRNEKDNKKTTVILTHKFGVWAVLFPDNRQPKYWGIKDLVIRSSVLTLACPRVKTRASCRLVPTSYPHSPTAPSGLQTRTQHNFKQLLLQGQQLAGSPEWTSTGVCLFLHLKSNPGPYLSLAALGCRNRREFGGGRGVPQIAPV